MISRSSNRARARTVQDHVRRLVAVAVASCALSMSPATRAFAPARDEIEPEVVPERPTWRFRDADRPVKVVVLAGSIGAFRGQPYARRLERMCADVEVRNLSRTGLGAWALKRRFAEQVLDNARVNPRAHGEQEHWLVFGGGLNSVGAPRSTNHHMRRLFLLAHRAGFRVVGLTLTPWGDEGDRRWRGTEGLRRRKATQLVSDFVLGKLTPREALGGHAAKRGDADAPWIPEELPDIAIDLYDSPLRDREAAPRELAAMREAVQDDRRWQRENARLDDATRALQAEADAQMAAELPRWYLRPELRSFDHIHPNAEGHRLIAATMCPRLPESWGCRCEPIEDVEADIATSASHAEQPR